jgi:hypothetical protein
MMKTIHATTNGNGKGNASNPYTEFSGEPIELTPQLGDSTTEYLEFCLRVEIETSTIKNRDRITATKEFRNDLIHNHLASEKDIALLFAKSVSAVSYQSSS